MVRTECNSTVQKTAASDAVGQRSLSRVAWRRYVTVLAVALAIQCVISLPPVTTWMGNLTDRGFVAKVWLNNCGYSVYVDAHAGLVRAELLDTYTTKNRSYQYSDERNRHWQRFYQQGRTSTFALDMARAMQRTSDVAPPGTYFVMTGYPLKWLVVWSRPDSTKTARTAAAQYRVLRILGWRLLANTLATVLVYELCRSACVCVWSRENVCGRVDAKSAVTHSSLCVAARSVVTD